ncbi:hypothetical protein PJL18_04035 [Paenarthrobacter nicotinovorans]|nr:hypothetical protein [Paenarthrobacter nicotinovorans]
MAPPNATPSDWTPRQSTAASSTALTSAVASQTRPRRDKVSAALAA